MAKLTRKTQKIFAEAGSAVGQFGSAQTGTPVLVPTNDPDIIQALPAYEQGWNNATISGDKRPPLEEFNGVLNKLDRQISYILQEGIAEYDAATEYYTNSIVKETGTVNRYKSLTDNNIGNPLSDPINWELIPDPSGLGTAAFKDVGLVDGNVPEIGAGDKINTSIIDTGITDGQIPIISTGNKLPNSIINDATESVAGIREIATQTEANDDSNDITFLTPQKLHNAILGYDFISEQTALTSTTLEFINLPIAEYQALQILFIAVKPSNDGVSLECRLSNDNGANWNQGATDYIGAGTGRTSTGGNTNFNTTGDPNFFLCDDGGGNQIGNAADLSYNGESKFYSLNSTSLRKNILFSATYGTNTVNRAASILGTGEFVGNTNAINGIQFFFSAGTIASGTFKLYGIK